MATQVNELNLIKMVLLETVADDLEQSQDLRDLRGTQNSCRKMLNINCANCLLMYFVILIIGTLDMCYKNYSLLILLIESALQINCENKLELLSAHSYV
jgi:hypothetical protein